MGSRMSRKDSRGMFANVLGSLEQSPPPAKAPVRAPSPHLMKVAAGVKQIQEKGEALDQILKDGDHIVEVLPDDIAPSAIPDRFDGAYEANAIEELIASMRERGQIVPGLIRPSRGGERPYQIVYGRRRLAAANSARVQEIRANGFLLATASYPSSGARLSFAKSVPVEFVDFLNSRMEALHSEFVSRSKTSK